MQCQVGLLVAQGHLGRGASLALYKSVAHTFDLLRVAGPLSYGSNPTLLKVAGAFLYVEVAVQFGLDFNHVMSHVTGLASTRCGKVD